jgi:hypothetical protein
MSQLVIVSPRSTKSFDPLTNDASKTSFDLSIVSLATAK